MITLSQTDQKKNKFSLGLPGRHGNLKDFEVVEGKTTFSDRPPLTAKAKVSLKTRDVFGGPRASRPPWSGSEGEEYLAGVRKTELVPAPSIKILDSNAKLVESGKLEYG